MRITLAEGPHWSADQLSAAMLADLFSFHPAAYAILGGEWGIEDDAPFGQQTAAVRHNLLLAGANAVAVDAIGASVIDLVPSPIQHS